VWGIPGAPVPRWGAVPQLARQKPVFRVRQFAQQVQVSLGCESVDCEGYQRRPGFGLSEPPSPSSSVPPDSGRFPNRLSGIDEKIRRKSLCFLFYEPLLHAVPHSPWASVGMSVNPGSGFAAREADTLDRGMPRFGIRSFPIFPIPEHDLYVGM
jgi:hypothetical protein